MVFSAGSYPLCRNHYLYHNQKTYHTTANMNALIIRTLAFLFHILLNVVLVGWLVNYDLTGSWLTFTGFILVLMILLVLFFKHLVSFIYFIKSRS